MRTVLVLLPVLAACTKRVEEPPPPPPDYARPLEPGDHALRLVTDPARLPDLEAAWRNRDERLLEALAHSEGWFRKPSTLQWFPCEGITHEQAAASVTEALRLLREAGSAEEFRAAFLERFDVYESVGYDGSGVVFFTGYFAPVFPASRTRTEKYRYPVYRRPPDLATDEQTGTPLGRRLADGGTEPYPTRAEIESSGMLRGQELAWLADPLSAFLVHVNGSARLALDDGSTMYLGYAGKTDRPYASLGQALVAAGLLAAGEVSLPAIRRVYATHPAEVCELMLRNESYVFFREQDGSSWPTGSLGFQVTPMTTLATDKQIFPRAGLVLVDTHSIARGGQRSDLLRFMADQDTGGAIRAPGRADIFMGVGSEAEALAGEQQAEGRLYYFFLKQPAAAEPAGGEPE